MKIWSDVYIDHRLKGMDANDAAFRADEWERWNRSQGACRKCGTINEQERRDVGPPAPSEPLYHGMPGLT